MASPESPEAATACPCGSGAMFDACCGPVIAGAPAPTAEALMRSRYAAFARGDLDHLERSLGAEQRKTFDRAAARSMSESVEWIGLDIVATSGGGEADDSGTVEFAAHFRHDGARQVHRERSSFGREDGRWVYLDGVFDPKQAPARSVRIGRNVPCPCGSGKKYKKCCGA
ncbi:MAG: YchJ family protein [Rhodospirillaceae bacterium]